MLTSSMPAIDEKDPLGSLKALRSYLVRLNKALDDAVGSIDEEALSPALKERIITKTESGIDELKNEIIETAREIRETSDRIELQLVNEYVAKGDIGSYTEEALQRISVDGKGVTQYFEEISSLTERVGGAERAIQENGEAIGEGAASIGRINAYVRTGKLDDGIYGIEIGNFSGGAEAPYKVRLSENRLSFFVFGEEAAYFSDNSMYISRARVPFSLSVGGCTMKSDRGLTFVAEG